MIGAFAGNLTCHASFEFRLSSLVFTLLSVFFSL